MEPGAQITVTTGPDEGKAFSLSDDLVHIGRGTDNHIILSDPTLNEHQASIVRRNGRYAIYAPAAGGVRIEDSVIPAERWVWLPSTAMVHLGKETVFQLTCPPSQNGSESDSVEVSTPTPRTAKFKSPRAAQQPGTAQPEAEGRSRKAREPRKRSHVARFLSDRSGEPLVKLGEDGQLPALELTELSEDRPRERRETTQSSNPLLLYAVLGFSFVMSLGLLLLSPDMGGPESASEKSAARAVVREFLGGGEGSFEPYQQLLRKALVDHSQGDLASERRHYRMVLEMLNSADIRSDLNGLTGEQTGRGPAGDDELRGALEVLLKR
jgi:FHA domain